MFFIPRLVKLMVLVLLVAGWPSSGRAGHYEGKFSTGAGTARRLAASKPAVKVLPQSKRHQPTLDDANASFLLAGIALILAIGGFWLIFSVGGGAGILAGIFAVLLSAYLGLWSMLLGEFPDGKPFRFSQLFKIK
ncbi:MAG TPA: hypothetical protein VF629_10595 [Hymenobacter sp.]|jgi:predicted lipid-binding transport protein (Tim44 family)|uniref:hypothetical protein n=1 Tax=Hymenobacter sp. TaxID=1898978 RepID=UPI002EDAAF75